MHDSQLRICSSGLFMLYSQKMDCEREGQIASIISPNWRNYERSIHNYFIKVGVVYQYSVWQNQKIFRLQFAVYQNKGGHYQ